MQDMSGSPRVAGDESDGSPAQSSGNLISRLLALFQPGKSEEAACPAEVMDTVQRLSAPVRRQTRRMMGRLAAFSRLRVDDVLVPRAEIIAIEADADVRSLMALFSEAQHSRLPVYRETLDDILGMVHIKDLFRELHAAAREQKGEGLILPAEFLEQRVEASGLMRPVLFAPPSMPAADLLLKMQATHLHMAVVVDEYGGTEGIITIEDLVEQIVGEISDEHDEEEDLITPTEGGYVVSARAPLEDLEALLGVDLLPPEQDEEVDTVGGLIFTMLGRVPVRGEVVRHKAGLEFEILDADPRRIRRVRVRGGGRPAAEELAGPGGATKA
jgi:CBS domain containing-hemolysin-like protein